MHASAMIIIDFYLLRNPYCNLYFTYIKMFGTISQAI